ncbi:SMP-30/gluconolactonase/LRE family protein [Planctellipticum variicoloris]|uniref:SMP-30/gluconolactonase/LRE family protein n=1 Tax=Planctellipticum variicoloris TaxID=3064265 RepID=UPI0030140695|nr:SMP-30/gluconolactonase/LRE family protein [Planctomycetaceae bacterium SH412]
MMLLRWLASGMFALSLSAPLMSEDAPPLVADSPIETLFTDFGLPDGPAWDGVNTLYIPDVKGAKLYRYNPAKNERSVVLEDSGRLSASFFNLGRLYVSDNGNGRISVLKGKTLEVQDQQDPDAKPPIRPNDLVVDKNGGVWYTLTGQNQVAYVSPQGQRSIGVEGIDSPNGLILSPDENTLYVAAYKPKQIWKYAVTGPGKTGPGALFATMDDGPELGADGMTTDRAGNVYCAGAKDVWIWSPAGKLLHKIVCPTRPINCAFGDANMQSLYITGFGGLYRQKMNISGKPPQIPTVASVQPANEKVPPTAVPETVQAHLDVVYAQEVDRKLLADIFVPTTGAGPFPAVLVVHGGGWVHGDKTKFRAMAVSLAACGYVTAAIEYRLAGEARFPAAIHDCNAATRFLRAEARTYHIDPNRIGAVGGSAGGHLVGLMATGSDVPELQGHGGHPDQSSRLQAAVVLAGPLQIATGSVAERSRATEGPSFARHFFGGSIDEARSLYELADAYAKISKDDPPILFQTGEKDNPALNADSQEKLKGAGVWTDLKIYPDGQHGCWNQRPWFDAMLGDIDGFLQEHLKP